MRRELGAIEVAFASVNLLTSVGVANLPPDTSRHLVLGSWQRCVRSGSIKHCAPSAGVFVCVLPALSSGCADVGLSYSSTQALKLHGIL